MLYRCVGRIFSVTDRLEARRKPRQLIAVTVPDLELAGQALEQGTAPGRC